MRVALVLAGLGLALGLAGCDDMTTQPKAKPYRQALPALPPGRTEFRERAVAPPVLTLALIERGQERFRQWCVACHSERGDGRGMVVQRGFPPPPSYHEQRLRDAPTQHFYDVITNGYGVMYSFAARVPPRDRWAIAAYIRALQRSEQGTPGDVPAGTEIADAPP